MHSLQCELRAHRPPNNFRTTSAPEIRERGVADATRRAYVRNASNFGVGCGRLRRKRRAEGKKIGVPQFERTRPEWKVDESVAERATRSEGVGNFLAAPAETTGPGPGARVLSLAGESTGVKVLQLAHNAVVLVAVL